MRDRYSDHAPSGLGETTRQDPLDCTPALQLAPWAAPSQHPGQQTHPGRFDRQIEAEVLRSLTLN